MKGLTARLDSFIIHNSELLRRQPLCALMLLIVKNLMYSYVAYSLKLMALHGCGENAESPVGLRRQDFVMVVGRDGFEPPKR